MASQQVQNGQLEGNGRRQQVQNGRLEGNGRRAHDNCKIEFDLSGRLLYNQDGGLVGGLQKTNQPRESSYGASSSSNETLSLDNNAESSDRSPPIELKDRHMCFNQSESELHFKKHFRTESVRRLHSRRRFSDGSKSSQTSLSRITTAWTEDFFLSSKENNSRTKIRLSIGTGSRKRYSKKDVLLLPCILWIILMAGITSVCLAVSAACTVILQSSDVRQLLRKHQTTGTVHGFLMAEEAATNLTDYRQAGLRGKMLQELLIEIQKDTKKDERYAKKNHDPHSKTNIQHGENRINGVFRVMLPSAMPLVAHGPNEQDLRFYWESAGRRKKGSSPRVVLLESSIRHPASKHRELELYPADFTDNTQLYAVLDSSDERIKTMEHREPHANGECVSMQDWQTTFHPSCNGMHEVDLAGIGKHNGDDFNLFGTKGFWRNAWRVDSISGHSSLNERETVVLKTLK